MYEKWCIFAGIVLLVVVLFITCHATYRPYNFAESTEQIEKVTFLELTNDCGRRTGCRTPGERIVLRELSPEEIPDFLLAFQTLRCQRKWSNPYDCVDGYTIEITYESGNYELICTYSNVYMNEDGKMIRCGWEFLKDREGFRELFVQYCPEAADAIGQE